jgi:ribonuclease P protein component
MAAKSCPPVVRRAGAASLSDLARDAIRFRRRDRLSRSSEFDRVLKTRTVRVSAPPFVALACASPTGAARLGLIVGKRHAPRAVDRNRIKRQVRETFRLRRSRLPAMDIVIQLVGAVGESDIRQTLEALWDRIEQRQQGRPG